MSSYFAITRNSAKYESSPIAIRRELETPRELEREIDWLEVLVKVRMESLFQGGGGPSIELPPIPLPPPLPTADAMARELGSPWAQLAVELANEPLARLATVLLLAAQLRTQALDGLQLRNQQAGAAKGPAAEAGGSRARGRRCSAREAASNVLPMLAGLAEARPPPPGSVA